MRFQTTYGSLRPFDELECETCEKRTHQQVQTKYTFSDCIMLHWKLFRSSRGLSKG